MTSSASYRYEDLRSADGSAECLLLRPLSPAVDAQVLHPWFNEERASYWGMQGLSLDEVRRSLERSQQKPGRQLWMGVLASSGKPLFLLERYDPAQDALAAHYSVLPGDCGIHVFVGPKQAGVDLPDLTWHVFRAINKFIFSGSVVQRIVAEPDIRNARALSRFAQAGYALGRVMHLPYKTAVLVTLTRQAHGAMDATASVAASAPALSPTFVRRQVFIGKLLRKARQLFGQ